MAKWGSKQALEKRKTSLSLMEVFNIAKTANRFEISSLLEKILLKQVKWCLTFVGLYITRFFVVSYYKLQTIRHFLHCIKFHELYLNHYIGENL